MVKFKEVGNALGEVYDPELHISITELGLIYAAALVDEGQDDGTSIKVTMSLTSPSCPYGQTLMDAVHKAISKIPGVFDVNVELTFAPTWDPRQMASEEAKEDLGIF